MKVLIVRSYPNKLNLNSYNIQEIGLAKALRKKNIECDIVFYNGFSKSRREITSDGITIYWQKGINIFKNGFLFGLSRIIKDYDVIQVHEYDQIQSWILYTFSHKKTIVYHGPYYDKFNKGYNLKCKIFDTLFLPLSKSAKKKVTCLTKSPFATEFLKSKGFINVYTAGVGLDVSMLGTTNTFDTFSSNHEVFRALYVGKLEERRNIEFLLSLAKALHERFNQFVLTVVGKFDNEQYHNKIKKDFDALLGEGTIEYIEHLPQKDLPALYQSSDIFLFTTNYDIFGMVLLEAMYYGSVPFSTINGGSKTLICDGVDGFLMQDYDISKWLDRISSLVNDKNTLIKTQRNSHRKIANNFTWDSLADIFINNYHN